jgi:hypothetical protein
MSGWDVLAGIINIAGILGVVLGIVLGIVAIVLATIREEHVKRQEATRNRVLTAARGRLEELRLDGPEAYVSAAEAEAFYRESERLRHELGIAGLLPPFDGPPAHPNCRCVLAPLEELAHALAGGELEVGIDWASGKSSINLVPSRAAVDALLEELAAAELADLERLSSEE